MADSTRQYHCREASGVPDPAGQRLSRINLTLSPGFRERAHACAAVQGGQPLTQIHVQWLGLPGLNSVSLLCAPG